MSIENNTRFRLKIAFLNLAGFIMAVCIPVYVDENTKNRMYDEQYIFHPVGDWYLLLTPFVFFLTFFTIKLVDSKHKGYWIACLPPVVYGLFPLFNFRDQEFGNMGVAGVIFGTFLIAFLTTLIHFSPEDTRYLHISNVHILTKIERLKASISLWQAITIYGTMGYMAFTIVWFAAISKSGEIMFKDINDQCFFNNVMTGVVFVTTLAVLFGPLNEAFQKTLRLIKRFGDIKG